MYRCIECNATFYKDELLVENDKKVCPKCNGSVVIVIKRIPITKIVD